LSKLEAAFSAGDTVSPKTLVAAGVVNTIAKRAPKVKILGTGDITKKLTVEGCEVSESAKAKIEKAGGSIVK
jgi:large subunit ribosomal protein L15